MWKGMTEMLLFAQIGEFWWDKVNLTLVGQAAAAAGNME